LNGSHSTFVRRNLSLLVGATAALAILVALYRFSPEESSFFPKCYFHYLTGLHCPGCGATRCAHSLLHGEIRQAAAWNILFLVSIPFLVYLGLRSIHRRIRHKRSAARRTPPWLIWLFAVGIVGFWIARNLNVEPFQLLAPHRL
jgi:hypothetical protein